MKGVVMRPHAPLMWILVPLMIGYGFSEAYPGIVRDSRLLLLGIVFLGAVGGVLLRNAPGGRFKLYAAVGTGALAALSYYWRETPESVLPEWIAPREAQLIVEVKEAFGAKEGRVAGLGVVRWAPEYVQWMEGKTVEYSGKWELPAKVEPGAWMRLRGVLAPLDVPAKNIPAPPPNIFHEAKKPLKEIPEDKGFKDYLRRMHVYWTFTRSEGQKIEKPANVIMHAAAKAHSAALKTLEARWNTGDNNQLLPAMVLGDKSGLTQKQVTELSRSSTTHLVVADGLNVVAVAAVLWVIVRLTGLSRLAQAMMVVGGLGAYALMVGAVPSVLRAWGMVAIVLFAWALRRQMNLWSVLVLAATVSLIVEPLCFLHAGWRLSFAVVSGIVLGMNFVERWGVLGKLRGMIGWAARVCAVSVAASLAVAPLTIAYWGIAQPLGFLVNAVTVSLGEMVKILGTASFLLGWLPWASKTINEVAYWLIGWIMWFIESYLKIPGAVVNAEGIRSSGVEVWGTLTVLTIFYVLSRYAFSRQKM